jgi:hypothetical protein
MRDRDIVIKKRYSTNQDAIDHLVSQGETFIGWSNAGVPYPKGHFFELKNELDSNTVTLWYPATHELISVNMS